jgi:cytosine/adenosine deaminase-related metal-dependent hydrolase
MRFFSAHYAITNDGPPLKRPVIRTENDGTILSVENTFGKLPERHSLEFYNGIIVPGFVNCHCHLELSWMKGRIPQRTGLNGFLTALNSIRDEEGKNNLQAMVNADMVMANEGVIICADICNTTATFEIKKKSRIRYLSLLEVFGIDSAKAQKRIDEIIQVANKADEEMIKWQLVPHSFYSVSVPLLRMIREKSMSNRVTSVHFLESQDEISFLSLHAGPLMDAYRLILSPASVLSTVRDHTSAVLEEITPSGNLLLVHNIFIDKIIINNLKNRDGIFYCLCPNSNRYICGNIPPLRLLVDEKCNIVTGTDSLSSNFGLSIMSELKTLQKEFPETGLEELIRWATINGARALGEEAYTGSIEPGKRPGLVLIENLDLIKMKLLPASFARRII